MTKLFSAVAWRDGVHTDAVFGKLHRKMPADRFKTALNIIGTAAVTPRIGLRARDAMIVMMPSTIVETSNLKSSAVHSVNGLVKKMPALLTK